jgi:AraC family carnitine catabolism transcriptional activator
MHKNLNKNTPPIDTRKPVHMVLVVIPQFQHLSLILAIETMRVANRKLLYSAFTWDIVSLDGHPVSSSCGLNVIPTASLLEINFAPVVIVFASWDPEQAYSNNLLNWLRHQDRQGAIIGGVETGAFILAKAGLLEGFAPTIHHESIAPFEEQFANSVQYDRLFSNEGRHMSSAGGVSTMDMMLTLIEYYHDDYLADAIAGILNYQRLSKEPITQKYLHDTALARVNDRLAECIELMQRNLEEPLSIEKICSLINVPRWKLQRLFQRFLKHTPGTYYMHLRLERARHLIEHERYPVKTIALACGFADTPSFSRAFKNKFQKTPSQSRKLRLSKKQT